MQKTLFYLWNHSNPFFTLVLLASIQKTFGHFQPPTKGAINGVIHHYAFFHQKSNGANIKWLFAILHQVIKASNHPEDSSRLRDKGQSQMPITSSINQWLFSFTVYPQGNIGSTFSRDILEGVPKQFSKGQCSINPPWQPNSFNTLWIHQDLYFIQTSSESHSTQFISQFGKVYTSSISKIQLQGFNTDQLSSCRSQALNVSHIPSSFDPGRFFSQLINIL
ncbi:hypothetical protein O181_077475 [Austropuccinia psidii MF-1]|uniref:Homing endonuclease LAGLIDADG domain-containing protein n=1 Tax=Austropuccinia psidii MF-1 TaxID=1389203 RepID=A0A9Q3IG07_9BASI|nr:hypothetical protein [Austropuccinia psidii MF-1]